MNTLVIDVGGSHVKVLVSGADETPREIDSGKEMNAEEMVQSVKKLTEDWDYERITLGYPGPVHNGAPTEEPINLAHGWVKFDYAHAFGCPVKIINDAAMQALGSYEGGRMLFLGFGTGLGSVLIADGHIITLSLGELPFKKGTFHDYLAKDSLERLGVEPWQKAVRKAVKLLQHAFQADYVVIGGGKADELAAMPEGVRRGDNHNAFVGGFRLWDDLRTTGT